MLDAIFLLTYTLNLSFVLIKCTIPTIFRIVVKYICEVSQARSTITTSPVSGARCYNKERVSLVHVTVITLIGLYTLIRFIHGVYNNVGVHRIIY